MMDKPMRRGTRSCRECRRRKVKCIYASSRSVCQECTDHSRQCQPQGYVRGTNPRQHVDQPKISIRVAKLESVIERLARNQEQKPEEAGSASQSPPSTVKSDTSSKLSIANLEELDQHTRQESPVFKLFQNEMIHQDNSRTFSSPSTGSIVEFSRPNMSDREKVLSPIANEPNVLDVLNYSGEWWLSWRHQPWATRDAGPHKTLMDYVCTQLKSENTVTVAIGMMCLAMALEQLRPGMDDIHLHLYSSAKALEDQILAVLDHVILSDDRYLASDDGILLLLMRGKHHVEGNQLRKAWLRIRQAILAAQQSDFTMASQVASSSPEKIIRQKFIGSIFELDRMLSMVLGLPYAVDENFTDHLARHMLPQSDDIDLKMRAVRRIAAVTAGQVNDRNAQKELSDFTTRSIQNSLNSAYNSMPISWWDAQTHLDNDNAADAHSHLMTQYWFWNVQTFLNLPYMLRAITDSTCNEGRQACLLGARRMLEIFNIFRLNVRLSVFTCNCEDFQGLLAACILLIGLLQDASQRTIPPEGYEQDLALVEETEEIFAYRAQQKGGSISKQGLKVLEQLSSFFGESDDSASSSTKAVILPYFGTIFISWNENMPRPSCFKQLLEKNNANVYMLPHTENHFDQNKHDQVQPAEIGADPSLWWPTQENGLGGDLLEEYNYMDFNMFDQDLAIDWNQFLVQSAGQGDSNAY